MPVIPVNEPLVRAKEIKYVTRALKGGWISSIGEFIERFEEKFASCTGRKYGVSVNNGTNALILAMRALQLPPGSEVIIPTFTIISCAMACVYNGLVPVFVDADPETWAMDVRQIENKISRKTKVIMPVHIYGYPVEMEAVVRLVKKHGLYVVEDFAEAIGSTYRGKKCGSFGDISCASFYANKVITTGEGGMCLTDDKVLAGRMKKLRNLAFQPGKRFVHEELGFNFRMTNIQAAIGLAQTEDIKRRIAGKVRIGKRYNQLLSGLEKQELVQLPPRDAAMKNTYWMYGLVLNERLGLTAGMVIKQLAEKGIEARPFFYPMHCQPALKKFPWFKKERLPVSERLYKHGFYLPSGLTLSDKEIEKVADCLKKMLGDVAGKLGE